jgi:poly-gamma-glutamate capsule biosynthesis protein CapA/YwtB (metallophosphatase superfamily)
MKHVRAVSILAIAAALLSKTALAAPLPSPTPAPDSPGDTATANLVFVGDIMLGRYVGLTVPPRDRDAPFKAIAPYLSAADLAIGNLEGPLVPTTVISLPRVLPNQLNLTADERMAPSLAHAGFDLLSLANNHIFDSRSAGLHYTTRALNRAGVAPFGLDSGSGQAPVVREVRGLKIAFLAYTNAMNVPGLRGVSIVSHLSKRTMTRMDVEIRAARTQADVVVVMMHWGTEYAVQLDAAQLALGRAAAEAGADLVVGSHPHVAQGMDLLSVDGRKVPVVYSLGNALFDQEVPVERKQGLSLSVTLDRHGVSQARLVPLLVGRSAGRAYTMNLADDQAGQPALLRAALSTPASLQWRAVWDAARPGTGLGIGYTRTAQPGASRLSVEDLGMGSPARVDLAGGTLTVSAVVTQSASEPYYQTVWTGDPGWRVTGYTVGDADANGSPDLVYTLWKRQQTYTRPPGGGLKVDPQGGDVLPHIYIESWKDGEMRPLWHGSPRPAPALAVAVAPVGKAHKPLLAVLESSGPYVEQALGTLTLWEWTGGFGYEIAGTVPGTYSALWSDGRVLLMR